MALFRRRGTDRGESGYRTRTVHGVEFHTSRVRIDDVAVVIRRFPEAVSDQQTDRKFVLVHGIGVSSRYFHPLAAELAKSGTVYLVDLPGYGTAPDPKRDVSIADHARVLGRFLDGGAIRNPVLVGHSMGTQVVSQLVLDRPEVSDRMVLLAPTVYPPARSAGTQAINLFRNSVHEPLLSNWTVFTDYFLRCGLPYYLRQLPHLLTDRIEDRLPRIATRSLVIRGDQDPIVPRAWAVAVAELLPDAEAAEVPGPHVIMYSAPRQVAELIVAHAR